LRQVNIVVKNADLKKQAQQGSASPEAGIKISILIINK